MGPLVEMIVFNSIPHIAGPETVALALKKTLRKDLTFFIEVCSQVHFFVCRFDVILETKTVRLATRTNFILNKRRDSFFTRC